MPPFNGSGEFSPVYNWQAQRNAGFDILASQMDTETEDITNNGLSNCITRDGQGSASANQPMNGFIHTNVGGATATNEYATAGQVQDNSLAFAVGAGTGDAITANFTPMLASLVDGMQLTVRAPGANTSTTPQFSPNGLTALTIKKNGGSALVAGDYVTNKPIFLEYVAAGTYWELLNPIGAASTITLSGDVSGTGTTAITTAIGANKITMAMLQTGSVTGGILANSNAANAGTNALGAVTLSTSAPSGTPANGDVWKVYTP